MSDSTSNLDLIAVNQSAKETTANKLHNAASPATYWAMRSIVGLAWGYYGGVIGTTRYPNGSLTLDPSDTLYLEHDLSGVVSFNSSGFTPGKVPDYIVITGASGVTDVQDRRGGNAGSIGISGLTLTLTDTRLTFTYVGSDSISRSGAMDLTP